MTNTTASPITLSALINLTLGAEFEDGKFAGVITLPDGKHVAVVLLPNKSDKRLKWADAMKWAEKVGGQLPTRPIAALLFANLKSEFEETWHWTNEVCSWDASDAWFCYFFDFQNSSDESYAGCARAVRLIHLEG